MVNPFETINSRLSNIENLILDLKHNQKEKESTQNELLTIQEASKLLKLSIPTLYSKSSKRELPGICKRGKRLYFSKSALLNWIEEGKRPTIEELEKTASGFIKNKRGGTK